MDEHYNPIVSALVSMPKPVVAAVNGVAAGAGASLAFACDLRLLADTAGFNLAFAGVALSCDTGCSYHLQRLVGRAKAIELLYFPRTVSAEESLELGLATQVVPPEELPALVAETAGRLAAGPTVALGAMRRSVAYAAGHSFEEAVAFESEMMTLTGATDGPRRRGRGVRREAEAGLRGPLSGPRSADPLELADPACREHLQHPPRRGDAHRPARGVPAVLDGERGAVEPVVVPAGHRAVAHAAAVEDLARQPHRAGHLAGEPRALGVLVDAVERLVEAQDPVRLARPRGSATTARVSGSDLGRGPDS